MTLMFVFVSVLVEGAGDSFTIVVLLSFFSRGRINRRLFPLAGCKERNAAQNTNVFLHTSELNLRDGLAVIAMRPKAMRQGSRICPAEPTGLEPATSAVTGRRSNQLS